MKRWVGLIILIFGLCPVVAMAEVSGSPEEKYQNVDPTYRTTNISGQISEQINSFDSKIVITPDNHVNVTETISYYFSDPRHGIYRTIPVVYNRGTDKVYYINLKLGGVTDENGRAYKVSQSDGDIVTLKIGDPNRTISGNHVYKISYELFPLVTAGENTDLFNFDVTGNDWQVPISATSATVVTPAAAKAAACFTGAGGATERACLTEITADGAKFSTTKVLLAGEGLTIGLNLPKGTVSNYLVPNVRPPINWWPLVPVIFGALSLLMALGYYLATILEDRRHKKDQTIIAQYEPPDGLSPAEIGYLVDDKANMVEVTAALIDTAVKGVIKIEQTAKGRWYRKARYRLHKLAVLPELSAEKSLISNLMLDNEFIDLDKVDRTNASEAVNKFKKRLGDNLKLKGYYQTSPDKSLKNLSKRSWFGIIYFVAFIFGFISSLGFRQTSTPLALTMLLISGAIFLYAKKRPRMTAAGVSEWAEIKGFQEYLSVVEKDRLKFTDAPEKTPELFSKLLPYAVALGVERQWAKQFTGMDLTQATGWYASPYYVGSFSSSALASDLSGGFASSVSSGFAAPSSSSGGGGGFSGSGFGGGGGGSW